MPKLTTAKYSIEDITDLIAEKTGCHRNEIHPKADIEAELGCTGDDFDELMVEYAQRFHVKMDNYLWYFHTDEEGLTHSIGRVFFKAPAERVTRIAVTPAMLTESANAGRWLLTYPEHTLPERRYDVLINQIVLVSFLAFLIYKCAT